MKQHQHRNANQSLVAASADQKQVKNKNLYVIFLVVMSLLACTPPPMPLFVTTLGYPPQPLSRWRHFWMAPDNNPLKFPEDSWTKPVSSYMIHNLLYEAKVIGVTKPLKSHVKTRSFSMGYRKREQKKYIISYKTSAG